MAGQAAKVGSQLAITNQPDLAGRDDALQCSSRYVESHEREHPERSRVRQHCDVIAGVRFDTVLKPAESIRVHFVHPRDPLNLFLSLLKFCGQRLEDFDLTAPVLLALPPCLQAKSAEYPQYENHNLS